jgi:hypothetical protein
MDQHRAIIRTRRQKGSEFRMCPSDLPHRSLMAGYGSRQLVLVANNLEDFDGSIG